MIKKIILLLFLASLATAQTVYTYCVWRESITKIISEDALEKYGYALQDMAIIKGQPFRMTSVLFPDNTAYIQISVAPKPSQWAMIHGLEFGGYIILISTYDTVNVWNPRYNCFDAAGLLTKVRDLPSDFYGVKTSTQ